MKQKIKEFLKRYYWIISLILIGLVLWFGARPMYIQERCNNKAFNMAYKLNVEAVGHSPTSLDDYGHSKRDDFYYECIFWRNADSPSGTMEVFLSIAIGLSMVLFVYGMISKEE